MIAFTVTGAESDKSSILLLRLQKEDGGFLWTHSVLQVSIGISCRSTIIAIALFIMTSPKS